MNMDFENYSDEAVHFLDRVAAELNTQEDLEHAFRVTNSVFQVLRDTISTEDSEEVIDLLPDEISDMYTEGWDPDKEKTGYETSEEFYNAIRKHSETVSLDFFNDVETRQAVQAVFAELREPLPGSLFERMKQGLPESVKTNV